jgi:hypothetical protein
MVDNGTTTCRNEAGPFFTNEWSIIRLEYSTNTVEKRRWIYCN